MAQAANVFNEEEELLQRRQQEAANKAFNTKMRGFDGLQNNAVALAGTAMAVMWAAFPPALVAGAAIAVVAVWKNKSEAEKAAQAARDDVEKNFFNLRQQKIALEKEKLELLKEQQHLGNQNAPTPQQPPVSQAPTPANPPQKQQTATLIIPTPPVAAATQQQTPLETTIEIEEEKNVTVARQTVQPAVYLDPSLKGVLGEKEQRTPAGISRTVDNVAALLAMEKVPLVISPEKSVEMRENDVKMDKSMGRNPSFSEQNKVQGVFIAALNENSQKNGATQKLDENSSEADKIKFVQSVQAAMLQAGAYRITTKPEDDAGRNYDLQMPLAVGVLGREAGASARIVLQGFEKDFNKHSDLMNTAAGLSAIEKHEDFQTDGKIDHAKVAAAFENGDFKSFENNSDPRIQGIYAAAEMVAGQYNKEQAQAKVQSTVEIENTSGPAQQENLIVNSKGEAQATFTRTPAEERNSAMQASRDELIKKTPLTEWQEIDNAADSAVRADKLLSAVKTNNNGEVSVEYMNQMIEQQKTLQATDTPQGQALAQNITDAFNRAGLGEEFNAQQTRTEAANSNVVDIKPTVDVAVQNLKEDGFTEDTYIMKAANEAKIMTPAAVKYHMDGDEAESTAYIQNAASKFVELGDLSDNKSAQVLRDNMRTSFETAGHGDAFNNAVTGKQQERQQAAMKMSENLARV